MIATLIGGTGLTGSILVRQLLEDPTLTSVISISRRSLNISNPKLTEVLIADLDELPSIQSKVRADLYFCCLGTTIKKAKSKENFEKVDHAAIVAFAKIAKAQDAKSFTFVSSLGANAKSVIFYNYVKGKTEDDVKALGLRSLNIFRPALLLGARQEFRLAEKIATYTVLPLLKILPIQTQKKFVTDVEALAREMLAKGKAAQSGLHVYVHI